MQNPLGMILVNPVVVGVPFYAGLALGAIDGPQVDVLEICPARIELSDVVSGADPIAVSIGIVHRSSEYRHELLSRHSTCSPREVRVRKTKAAARLISQ